MIYPSKYNGINFSYDFSRESNTFNFDNQRRKNILPLDNFKNLSFLVVGSDDEAYVRLKIYNENGNPEIIGALYALELNTVDNRWIYFFGDFEDFLPGAGKDIYFSFQRDDEIIYSEIYTVKSKTFLTDNEICKITAYNNDSRHGYLTKTFPAFGFFKFSKLNSDFFINSKVEYEYSYGRKMILSSENNIGKRFTFLDLTMYQQNLIKWLCNTENLFIDGVKYQLISDFTELLADENSEIKDLRADFVEVNQSFFNKPSTSTPKNIFTDQFFM